MVNNELRGKLQQELENVQEELGRWYTHNGALNLNEYCALYCATYRLSVLTAELAGIELEQNDCGTWSTVEFEGV